MIDNGTIERHNVDGSVDGRHKREIARAPREDKGGGSEGMTNY